MFLPRRLALVAGAVRPRDGNHYDDLTHHILVPSRGQHNVHGFLFNRGQRTAHGFVVPKQNATLDRNKEQIMVLGLSM